MISTMDSLNNSNTSHNTQTMSFKQTLKLHHNDNVIKTFNHSSKLAFKLAKTSCHISFLKSCRDFSITPKGLTLSDPLKSCRSHEFLQKAQSLLVTSRLQQYKRDYATTESLYLSLLQQLQVSLNNTDHYEHILHLNSVKIDTTMQTFICKHSKKFQVLLAINNLHLVSPYNAFLQHHHKTQRTLKSTISGPLQITKPVPNKKTTIINLSDEKLTLDETSQMKPDETRLGLKFTPTPKNNPTTDIASHIQPAVKHLPDGMQSSIADDVTHLLHSPPTAKSNLQPHLQLALKNLKTKTQRLKIFPADKGNSIVILTHKQYHDKVQQHIDEGPYTRHPHYLLNSTAYLNVYSLTTKSLNHFTTHVETFTHVRPNYMAHLKFTKLTVPFAP